MRKNKLSQWLAGIAAAASLIAATPALAEWPERPVNFVVPSAAGGSPDVLSRVITNELSKILKTPVVVENKPGAAGNIGLLQIINRPADGYTIGYGNVNTLAVNRALFKKLPYDVDKDLAPVAHVFDLYNVLIVPANSPYKTAGELIAAARKTPGKLSFGAPGVGTTGHMSGEVFRAMAKIDVLYVPYNGGPAALQDLMGGRTDFLFANSSEVVPLVAGGKVRALGVTSLKRLALLPNVPTLDESGLKGYEMGGGSGLLAPRGTPPEILKKLELDVRAAIHAVREQYAANGLIAVGSSSAEFAANLKSEIARLAALIRATGAKVE